MGHPEHEYLRDGGWGYEADGQEICDTCGVHLRCTLTNEGIEQELENWSSARINLRGKFASWSAFELLNILECAYMGDLDWATWLQGYQRDRAKAIQRGVKQLVKRIDGIRARRATKDQQ